MHAVQEPIRSAKFQPFPPVVVHSAYFYLYEVDFCRPSSRNLALERSSVKNL